MRIIPVAIGIKEYQLNSGTPIKRKIVANRNQLVIVEKKTKSKIPLVYFPRIYLSTKLDEAQKSGASSDRKIQFILFRLITLVFPSSAAGPGFEPRYSPSEGDVLPLDDPAIAY